MNYFMMHTFFIIMVVFGILAVTAFLVCVIKVIIFEIRCRRVGGGVSVGYDI